MTDTTVEERSRKVLLQEPPKFERTPSDSANVTSKSSASDLRKFMKLKPSTEKKNVIGASKDRSQTVRVKNRSTTVENMSMEDLKKLFVFRGIDLNQNMLLKETLAGYTEVKTLLEATQKSSFDHVLHKVLDGRLAVENWNTLCNDLVEIFHSTLPNQSGHNAEYIPVLKNADSEKFGVALCTVDGQQFSYGDAEEFASIQSCVKPLVYGLACEEIGIQKVHQYIGVEPSGLAFNDITLSLEKKPHNPMINSGAIACCSLLKRHLSPSTRFRFLLDALSNLAGGKKIGFSQETYLAEFETAYRNNAIVHFLEATGCAFPKDTDIDKVLDFYIQCCAVEVNCQIMSVIAATLANGGVNPLTGKVCMSSNVVRSVLTLMLSCGMYDYSGQWCVSVGLPSKSGVAGFIFVVVPGIMGFAIFSPRLDERGNSVRGIEFCKKLLSKYNYGIFEQLALRLTEEDELKNLVERSAAKSRTAKLWNLLKYRVLRYKEGFDEIATSPNVVTAKALEEHLKTKGLNPQTNRYLKNLLNKITKHGLKFFQHFLFFFLTLISGEIHFRNIFFDQKTEENVINKMLTQRLKIQQFQEFAAQVKEIFEFNRKIEDGRLPDKFQELAYVPRDAYGMAICSIDGQQLSLGDSSVDFPIFEGIQILLYAIAIKEMGQKEVHTRVGEEPSSTDPHGFCLNFRNRRPYNPFVDAGAMTLCSMILPGVDSSTRYTHILKQISEMAGDTKLTFSQPLYLERKDKDHMLMAVSSMMKAESVYPESASAMSVVDFYTQLSSMEINCENLAVIAATLANGGVCPLTKKRCFSEDEVKTVLSHTYACGMGQFAGQWNFMVGLPAVAGLTGSIMVIIPNVMGLVIYSPRLNRYEKSVRGIEFCRQFVHHFRLSMFDQLVYHDTQVSADKEVKSETDQDIDRYGYGYLSAAARGKVEKLRSFLKRGVDVNYADYDQRTALHLAASEGHVEVVKFLLERGANPLARDRWRNTPFDDAKNHNHQVIQDILQSVMQ